MLAVGIGAAEAARAEQGSPACLNEDELELAALVDDYRKANGRKPIPLSRTLTKVAQWHTVDTAYAVDVSGKWGRNPKCNLHSWFGMPGTTYDSCCYTSDHARAQCMWKKPKELSGGRYTSAGFENAAVGHTSTRAAVEAFKSSPAHADVILNRGVWKGAGFKAMGVGVDPIHRSYYLWFGQQADPAGSPSACASVACPARASRSCKASFSDAKLTIDESSRGNERLVAKWLEGRAIPGKSYGNPRKRGGTQYAVCVYDDDDRLAGEYVVAAAGERCSGSACWKRLGKTPADPVHKGYTFLDRQSRHDGIRSLRLKGGKGASQAVVRGVNNKQLGRRNLPTGVASALRGSRRATIQLHAGDEPLCLSARLGSVVTDTGRIFKALK